MIRTIAARAWNAAVDTFGRPPDAVTHEVARLTERCRSDRWEAWTTERGLAGLTIGHAEEWLYGYRLRCRLGGRLDAYDVIDKGSSIVTALGLVRGTAVVLDDGADVVNPRDLTEDQITNSMIAAHRRQRGSVLMVLPTHRSDRVDLWLGLHDRLAPVAAVLDAERERRDAQEAAEKAARHATAPGCARVTGTGTAELGQTVGFRVPWNAPDLRVHQGGRTPHTTGSGTVTGSDSQPTQRARELIGQGVRDTAALARQLEREGVRVPSASYLRRLVREARS